MNDGTVMTVKMFDKQKKQAEKNKARFIKLDRRERKLMDAIDSIRARKQELLGEPIQEKVMRKSRREKPLLPYGALTKIVKNAFETTNELSTDKVTDFAMTDKRLAKIDREIVRERVRNVLATSKLLFKLTGHSQFEYIGKPIKKTETKSNKSRAAKMVKPTVEVKPAITTETTQIQSQAA